MVAAAMCLGLAALIYWQPAAAPPARAWAMLAVWSAVWAICAAAALTVTAADIAGVGFARLSVSDLAQLLHSTELGQWGLAGVVCPLVLCAIGVDAMRGGTGWHPALVAAVTSLGIISGPVTGHLSLTTVGALVIVVHAVAAAAWLGPLLAAAAVITTSAGWTRFLPHYSRLAWWSALTVTLTGTLATVVRVTGADVSTGYLTILGLKVATLVGLLAGGYRLRRAWVNQPVTARRTSLRYSIIETAVMATAFGLASTLSYTP